MLALIAHHVPRASRGEVNLTEESMESEINLVKKPATACPNCNRRDCKGGKLGGRFCQYRCNGCKSSLCSAWGFSLNVLLLLFAAVLLHLDVLIWGGNTGVTYPRTSLLHRI